MGPGPRLFVLLIAGVGAFAPPVAAQEEADTLFVDPAASPAALAERLTKMGPEILASRETVLSPVVSTYSVGDENDKRFFHQRVTEVTTRCREALTSLGFQPPEAGKLRLAVRVYCAIPDASVVVSTDGSAVLVRLPFVEAAVAKPPVPERWDGPPLFRDILRGSEQGVRWLRQERVRSRESGPGSLSLELARSLVGTLGLPAGVPPWVREGLASWAEQKARGEGAPPPHAPGIAATSEGAALWKAALSAEGPVPPRAVVALGRAMDTFVQGKTDLPARLAKLAGGAPPAGADVFGVDPAQAAMAAASRLQPKEGGCRADGTIACFLCRGAGRHTVDCTECEGMGAVPCPSCGGSEICPAPQCDGGFYPAGAERGFDCELCNGDGWVYCVACKDPALKCVPCGGRGKFSWPCALCERGRLPCPECPRSEDASCGICKGKGTLPCAPCTEGRTAWSCAGCNGAGYRGCDQCFGYGWVSGAGNTDDRCKGCSEGKRPCATCGGKGTGKLDPTRCPGHAQGSPVRPCPACAPSAPAVAAEVASADPKVLQAAIAFLCASTDSYGAFSYRGRGTTEAAGSVRKHNLFTNAVAVWTLFTAGRTKEDPAVVRAWKVLEAEAAQAADSRDTETGTQEAAFALRALLVGGLDPKSKLATGLVSRLIRSQRPDGLWADDIKTREVRGDVLNALIVLEALRVAKDRGMSVPSEVWSRAHGAAQKLFSSRKVKAKKGDILHGTDVACCVAMIVLTKAGSLGDKAATFDYRSLNDVKAGLSWLDRHFDPRGKPTYYNGARVHRRDLEGYYAYMYSMQRLAMLLGISEFNGHRWFPEGAAHLAAVQRKDGSFEELGYGGVNGSAVCTTFAVLFLVRATTPITESSSR